MRDYGVVRVRFWEWAKRKKLSCEAREMALYLLTCPHGNSLGCFRLPMAYLCDDLGTAEAKAARTMCALEDVGFMVRDAESGWTWIIDFLEHNPIPNGNVGKAIGKMVEAIPASVSFYGDLLKDLRGLAHFPPNLIETITERYRKGFDRVSRPPETHTQTHTHDHEQEHNHEHEQGRGGAVAPLPTVEAMELFNAAADENGWPRVQVLNPARKRSLAVCLLAVGDINGFQSLIAKATASDFLCGRSRRSDDHANWRCDFDFLLKKHIKIMEGGYDNAPNAQQLPERGIGAVLAALAE